MSLLNLLRLAKVALGLLGIPYAVLLLELTSESMRRADRRSVRQMAQLFFWLTIGIMVGLLGGAFVNGILLITTPEVTFWPSVVQIASMAVFDGALVGMLHMTRTTEREQKKNRGN